MRLIGIICRFAHTICVAFLNFLSSLSLTADVKIRIALTITVTRTWHMETVKRKTMEIFSTTKTSSKVWLGDKQIKTWLPTNFQSFRKDKMSHKTLCNCRYVFRVCAEAFKVFLSGIKSHNDKEKIFSKAQKISPPNDFQLPRFNPQRATHSDHVVT